jgi:hypothetical protein
MKIEEILKSDKQALMAQVEEVQLLEELSLDNYKEYAPLV